MRYLFFGLFILALLSGLAAWHVNRPLGKTSFLGETLSAVGVKQRVESQHAVIRRFMASVVRDQQRLIQDINDHKAFLEDTDQNIQTLSDLVATQMDDKNADILRLKTTLQDLQNRNRLVIEQGRELIKRNQEELKQRQDMLADASVNAIDSSLNEERLNQMQNQLNERREDYLNTVSTQVVTIHDMMQSVRDKVQDTVNAVFIAKNEQLDQRREDMKIKTNMILDQVEARMQRLRDQVMDNKARIESGKDRLRDLNSQANQQYTRMRDLTEQRKQTVADRTRDQMERLKEQRARQEDR